MNNLIQRPAGKIGKLFARFLITVVLFLLASSCARQPNPTQVPPTATPSLPPTITQMVNGTVQPGPAKLDSVEAAQALVPFTLLVPDASTIPASLELTETMWWPEDEKGMQAVALEYQSSEASLTLTEIQLTSRMTAPEMPYQALRVRGQVAFLISQEEANNKVLLWQEDQRAMFLSVEGLSTEELVAIAEGLKPAQ